MRSYPRNSPEAAARLVALVLICDGHVCRSEIQALQQLQAEQALGLPAGGFAPVVHTLCEDLLMCTPVGDIDEATLAALLAEVDDPALQQQVLRLAAAAAAADQHLAEAEAQVMAAARRQWGAQALSGLLTEPLPEPPPEPPLQAGWLAATQHRPRAVMPAATAGPA